VPLSTPFSARAEAAWKVTQSRSGDEVSMFDHLERRGLPIEYHDVISYGNGRRNGVNKCARCFVSVHF